MGQNLKGVRGVDQFKIVCICQVYNELLKDNLKRFIKYLNPLVDDFVFYDDGSTDGSYEYLLDHTPHVIRGDENDFVNERKHKQLMLEKALRLNPDFILWLDADEILTANAETRLQKLCGYCEENNLDGISLQEVNIWRSHSWKRVDSGYNNGIFVRLWRVTPDLRYDSLEPGLHQKPYPSSITEIQTIWDVKVLHYGFSSKKRLAYKYLTYKAHGQQGYYMLDRLISEERLMLKKVPKHYFPEGLWIDDDPPQPLSFEESLAYVEEYKKSWVE